MTFEVFFCEAFAERTSEFGIPAMFASIFRWRVVDFEEQFAVVWNGHSDQLQLLFPLFLLSNHLSLPYCQRITGGRLHHSIVNPKQAVGDTDLHFG
jgi:hypothetical protein